MCNDHWQDAEDNDAGREPDEDENEKDEDSWTSLLGLRDDD
jgi:hypothetical protein